MKITFFVVFLIATCFEFQEISGCLHQAAPCEKVLSCKTDEHCNGGTCGHIQQNFPYTGKVIIYVSNAVTHRRLEQPKKFTNLRVKKDECLENQKCYLDPE